MDLSAQLSAGIKAAQETIPPNISDYSKVVLVGVGGSAMPAEAIGMLWLDQPEMHIAHGYRLPHWIKTDHLVIATSWSGETAETIDSLKQAISIKIPTIAITSSPDSQLATIAKEAGLATVIIPRFTDTPRLAMPAMLAAQLTIIGQSAILDKADEFTQALLDKAMSQASHLAQAIGNSIPLFYSSFAWRQLGAFWKKFINETVERHCFSNYLPRAIHDEIAAINSEADRFCYMLMSDPSEEIETVQLKRLASWFEKRQQIVLPLEIAGQSRLEKILFQYLLAEKTSAHLAGGEPFGKTQGEHKTPAAIKEFKQFSA